MAKERDRITFDLKDLRERLQSASTEPSQSLASVLRWVATLGLDLLDACRRLRIPPPRLGEIDQWLVEISKAAPPDELKSNHNESLIKYLSSLEKRPSNAEISTTATKLCIDSTDLMRVCDRLFSKFENGND